MIQPIHIYGEDILRKRAEEVDINDPTLPQIIADMFDTMYNAKGAGIAAPQIGVNKRIFVIDEEVRPLQVFKDVFINPKITFLSNHTISMSEGCLSVPGISARINRPYSIHVEWYDQNLKFRSENFIDIESRIIQHETDHLNGLLFIDRMDIVDKMKVFMKLEDIRNKKIKSFYVIQ